MNELSLQTIQIIAWEKILLALSFFACIVLLRFRKGAWWFALLSSLTTALTYIVLSWPLQKMWWGNNGDETFVFAFFSQVLRGNPFNDFYYHTLPTFYPPLYFWVTGFFARGFAENAITAAKSGVVATLLLWFIGTYAWVKAYFQWIHPHDKESQEPIESPWLWFTIPLIFFFLVDFNDIILKPYETLPALLVVLWTGLLFLEFSQQKTWRIKHVLFFGVSGGILFLTYYFWWFIVIPAMFVGALAGRDRVKNIGRIVMVGSIMLIVSSVYLIPLFLSYRHGIENWQAIFFIPKDFDTFLPFVGFSWRTVLILLGIIGLITNHKKPFVRGSIILLAMGYVYQYVSIVLFLLGGYPLQASKPFLFLGTASLCVGTGYAIDWIWTQYAAHLTLTQKQWVGVGLLILSLPFWPMVTFMDDPVVRTQIEKDLHPPSAYYLAPKIQQAVPDYAARTWLSSGIPELNAYLPMHYYLAHSPHFSHPAARYYERLQTIESLARSSPQTVDAILQSTPIDALLLYKNGNAPYYPLFYWNDRYPNGGEEKKIHIPKTLIETLGWKKTFDGPEWVIYLK